MSILKRLEALEKARLRICKSPAAVFFSDGSSVLIDLPDTIPLLHSDAKHITDIKAAPEPLLDLVMGLIELQSV